MTRALQTRLTRLEQESGLDREDQPLFYRQLIYNPKKWEIGEEEAIAQMKTEELHRLVAAGEIKETERARVGFILWIIKHPSRPEQLAPTEALTPILG